MNASGGPEKLPRERLERLATFSPPRPRFLRWPSFFGWLILLILVMVLVIGVTGGSAANDIMRAYVQRFRDLLF